MECKCIKQYNEVKPGMIFDIVEIYADYYVLESKAGWSIEVSNNYFNECFKIID